MTDVELIREILESELEKGPKVSRYYLANRLRRRVTPQRLRNVVFEAKINTKDGVKNMELGAERIIRDSLRCLSGEYEQQSDGWIVRRESQ